MFIHRGPQGEHLEHAKNVTLITSLNKTDVVLPYLPWSSQLTKASSTDYCYPLTGGHDPSISDYAQRLRGEHWTIWLDYDYCVKYAPPAIVSRPVPSSKTRKVTGAIEKGKPQLRSKPVSSPRLWLRPHLEREEEALCPTNLSQYHRRALLQQRHLRDPKNGPLSERQLNRLLGEESAREGHAHPRRW